MFIKEHNGVSFLPSMGMPHFTIHTDASGSWGCAGLFNSEWFQLQWSAEWVPQAIMVKELVPIIILVSVCYVGPLVGAQVGPVQIR